MRWASTQTRSKLQIGVVVIEDDPRYRRSLALFAEEPGFFLAGSFDSPSPFLRTAEKAASRGGKAGP